MGKDMAKSATSMNKKKNKNRILSIESWFFNRDPYNGCMIIIPA